MLTKLYLSLTDFIRERAVNPTSNEADEKRCPKRGTPELKDEGENRR
jgi:hypothetical protein